MNICKCGTTLGRKNASGFCRSCAARNAKALGRGKLTEEQRARRVETARRMSSDPAIIAKRSARSAATRADPEFRKRHAEACRVSAAKRLADPEVAAIYRENGRKFGKPNFRNMDEAMRAKAVASTRAKHLAWCPQQHWELNAKLKRNGYKLEERKRIILSDTPGTIEHARRQIENVSFKMALKAERELAQQF